MNEVKKYISEDSKILTDEYVEMMFQEFEKSPLELKEFIRDLEISNKEQSAIIRRKKKFKK